MRHILLVEDDRTMRLITEATLKGAGYYTTMASNGDEAIAFYKQSPISFILLDCNMPGPSGWETAREIRRFEKLNNLASSTIMLFSSTKANAKDITNNGLNGFIKKPFQTNDFLAEIAKAYSSDVRFTPNLSKDGIATKIVE